MGLILPLGKAAARITGILWKITWQVEYVSQKIAIFITVQEPLLSPGLLKLGPQWHLSGSPGFEKDAFASLKSDLSEIRPFPEFCSVEQVRNRVSSGPQALLL